MRPNHLIIAFALGLSVSQVLAKECIGVVPAGGGQAFWGEVELGARQAGKELGIDVYVRGPQDETNADSQKKVIDIIEKMNCTALVLAPNVAARNTDVARLKKKGIPTVYIDRTFSGNEAIAVIATDNYKAGQLAAKKMSEQLKGQGRVAIFHMQQGVQSTDERERGFQDACKKLGLTVVNETWLSSNVGEARIKSLQVLTKSGDTIDGIFTPNEATTLATLLSLKQLGLGGRIRLIGFDMRAMFADALRDGSLGGVVVQNPQAMGFEGVKVAFRATKGILPTEKNQPVEVTFLDQTSATIKH
jgi:ribose transport system substrate-binding protein